MNRAVTIRFRSAFLVTALAVSRLVIATEARGQSQPPPSVAELNAAFGQQWPNLPSHAQPSPVPPGVQKRLEILRDLHSQIAREGLPAKDSLQARAMALAKGRVKNNDVSGAEEIAAAISPFEIGTADWHLDTGHRLRMLGDEIAREGSGKNLPEIVKSSLRHFDDAFTRARQDGNKGGQAAAKISAAFLHERYVGDFASAIAAYKAALREEPDNPAALEGLGRLERSLAILEERVRAHKK